MNEAFCFAKAYFMVRFFDQTPEKNCPVWNIHSRKPLSYRRFVLDFAFCILHFAFRAQPDKPKFESHASVAFLYPIQRTPFSTLPHSSQKLSRSAVSVAVMGISPKASPLQV